MAMRTGISKLYNVFLISMFTFINFSLHLLGKHANNSIQLEDEFDLFKSCCCLKGFRIRRSHKLRIIYFGHSKAKISSEEQIVLID